MSRKWLYPHAQERQLDRFLQAYAKEIIADVDSFIISNIDYFLTQSKLDADEDQEESWSEELLALIALLLLRASTYDLSSIYTYARNIAAYNEYQFKLAVNSAMKVVPALAESNLGGVLASWSTKVKQLVVDKATAYIKSVESIVRNEAAIQSKAKTTKEIIAKRREAFSGQVNFTAINETGSLNSQLQRSRLMGITALSYVWTTQRDERVRPLHAQRQGKVFSWKVVPSDGHPGMPARCRCVATPVLDFDFENQFPIDPMKRIELVQYRPGVGQAGRDERSKEYGAALRSGKLTPGEILALNRNKSSAREAINSLLSSGRLSQDSLNKLMMSR